MLQQEERFVKPKVYLIGQTTMNEEGVLRFLTESKQMDFWDDVLVARKEGISDMEILCSLYAKLCYRSLVVGKNVNVQKVRSVQHNIKGAFDSGHGSVFEAGLLNFVVDDCSRVFTHEIVRHRAGTHFSQTSGRYCRIEDLRIVWDPILDPVKDIFAEALIRIEDAVYLAECKLGLRKPVVACLPGDYIEKVKMYGDTESVRELRWVPDDTFNFDKRKKLTSAIRRIAPNGQENEMGVSLNLRALRHTMLLRTAKFAEWEIRYVFAEIYRQLKDKFPLLFYGAKTREIEGITEVYGMKCQPYELSAVGVLEEMTDEEAAYYIKTRPKALAMANQVA